MALPTLSQGVYRKEAPPALKERREALKRGRKVGPLGPSPVTTALWNPKTRQWQDAESGRRVPNPITGFYGDPSYAAPQVKGKPKGLRKAVPPPPAPKVEMPSPRVPERYVAGRYPGTYTRAPGTPAPPTQPGGVGELGGRGGVPRPADLWRYVEQALAGLPPEVRAFLEPILGQFRPGGTVPAPVAAAPAPVVAAPAVAAPAPAPVAPPVMRPASDVTARLNQLPVLAALRQGRMLPPFQSMWEQPAIPEIGIGPFPAPYQAAAQWWRGGPYYQQQLADLWAAAGIPLSAQQMQIEGATPGFRRYPRPAFTLG